MKENILETIGNTPLVRLNKVVAEVDQDIYAKLEFLNPGGSVKDRIGIAIIDDAEKRGLLKPGGTIVEATSGNTGIGLALVAAVRGYKMIFVMPDKMSDEKVDLLKAFEAKVVITPTKVAPDDERSYYNVAKKIVAETPGSFYANQCFNPANPEAHYLTGKEIWADTKGKIDVLVAGIGTGGTISGTAKYLKEKNSKVQVVGVDPKGSIYADYFKTGKIVKTHTYKVEGIGEDMLPGTVWFDYIDEIVKVNDKESFLMTRRLAKEEGIFAGGSSGSAVVGALKYAGNLKERKLIVVILPDSGSRYLSKIFSDRWMKENKFLEKGGKDEI